MNRSSRPRLSAAIAATLALIVTSPCLDASAATRKHHKKATTPQVPLPDVTGELDASKARLYADLDGEDDKEPTVAQKTVGKKVPASVTVVRTEESMCREVNGRPAIPQNCDFGRRMCQAAGLPDGEPVWVIVSVPDAGDPNRRNTDLNGYRCRPPGEEHPAPVPALDQHQLRELPLPAGKAHVQPSSGPLLVNMPTNVYVDAPTVTLRTTLLGRPIEVEATAARFVWDFGDGEKLTTADTGAPYPHMTTTHTYSTPGKRKITLTTVYTAQFRAVGTDEWLPAQGAAEVQTVPIDVELIETRAVLVP